VTSGCQNSTMITDHRKFTSLAYTLRIRNLRKFSATSDAGWQHGR